LTWLENGNVVNFKRVIPVPDGVEYQCSYLDFKDEKWVPIENPMKPTRQCAAFGKPLTREQVERLAKVQVAPPPTLK
jgi:hypothetical protein